MSEHDEQVALFEWAALCTGRWPEIELLHAIPNGGHRHVAVARKMKAEGVKAGVPDLCLPVARGGYHGLYIELKHGRNTVTAEQEEWLNALSDQGYYAATAYEFDGASEMIEAYLNGELKRRL